VGADGVVLRAATPADEPLLRAVFAGTRAIEAEALGAAAGGFLSSQYELQLQAFSDADTLVIEADGVAVGRLLLRRTPGELEVVDLAVLADRRGEGIGTAVLEALGAAADAEGRKAILQVERGNPALRLYERLGFVVTGQTERHLVMERPLS
jgi:ribosomal protein S18 acetylase RimI-like enzyme